MTKDYSERIKMRACWQGKSEGNKPPEADKMASGIKGEQIWRGCGFMLHIIAVNDICPLQSNQLHRLSKMKAKPEENL